MYKGKVNSMDNETRQQKERAIWDRLASRYELRAWAAFEDAYRRAIDLVKEKTDGSSIILDVGCGPGLVSRVLASHVDSVAGIDISTKMIAVAAMSARKHSIKNVRYVVQDGYAMPFPDDSFDAVLLFNLLHVVQEPERVLSEARRLLKPEGRLFTLTDCYGEMKFSPIWLAQKAMKGLGAISFLHFYERSDVEQLLARNGFLMEHTEVLHRKPLNYFIEASPKPFQEK